MTALSKYFCATLKKDAEGVLFTLKKRCVRSGKGAVKRAGSVGDGFLTPRGTSFIGHGLKRGILGPEGVIADRQTVFC